MLGIYTAGIIARMADKKIFGYRTIMKFVRESVGNYSFTFNLDSPITRVTFISCPFPTFMKRNHFYFIPKSLHIKGLT